MAKNSEQVRKLSEKLKGADIRAENLEKQIENLLIDKRRKNCKISGLDEYKYESKSELIRRVVDIIVSQHRDWDLTEKDIETAYRVGKRGRQPRPIIVAFLRQDDAERLLGDYDAKGGMKARFGVRVGPDLTAKQRQEMNDLWEQGMMGVLKGGKVVPVERGVRDQWGERGNGRHRQYSRHSRNEGFGRRFGRYDRSDEERDYRQRPTHNPRNLVPVREQPGANGYEGTWGARGQYGGDCDDYESDLIDFDPAPARKSDIDPCGDWLPRDDQEEFPWLTAGGRGRIDGGSSGGGGGEGSGTVESVDPRAAVKPQTGATSPPPPVPRDRSEAPQRYIFAADTDEDEVEVEAGVTGASHDFNAGHTAEAAREGDETTGEGLCQDTSGVVNGSEIVNNNKDSIDSESEVVASKSSDSRPVTVGNGDARQDTFGTEGDNSMIRSKNDKSDQTSVKDKTTTLPKTKLPVVVKRGKGKDKKGENDQTEEKGTKETELSRAKTRSASIASNGSGQTNLDSWRDQSQDRSGKGRGKTPRQK